LANQVVQPKKITSTQTARRKLELSQVTSKTFQQELMGTDVGVDKLAVYLSSQIRFDVGDRIVDANVSRSIDASTTLTVTIDDYDRAVLNSGYLYNKLDVQVDGLWFRLMGVDKSGDTLTLTFEDREIAVLRTYTSWKVALRSQVTRAEFILNLIQEVKEFKIPVVIPELHTVQPLQRYDGDTKGIDATLYKRKGITVESQAPKAPAPTKNTYWVNQIGALRDRDNKPLTKEKLANANTIIGVGEQMKANRKVIVSAVTTSIEEANLINNPGGTGTSAGLFQQIDQYWGSYEDRTNPETSSRMYYQHAIENDAKWPHLSINDLCQSVQGSAYPNRYGIYEERADRIVTAYGITGGLTETDGAVANGQQQYNDLGAGGSFYFYRGNIENRLGQKIRKPENTWTCIQRLADDVNWKAFFVSGTFYYISEDDLIKQQPAFTMNEWTEGIISVDGNFYEHKDSATLTVTADVGRWKVPPGALVIVQEMGPWDGRWLVSEYDRSLFNTQASITLTRERPALPEPNPKGGNKTDVNPSWVPKAAPATGTGIAEQGTSSIASPPTYQVDNLESLAKQLIKLHNKGWTDHNTGYQQMLDTANGKKLYYPGIGEVSLDPRIISVILWLISDQGYNIGTYAWCTDHSTNDGASGHAGGHAVDISDIDGVAINQLTPKCLSNVLAVDKLLNGLTGYLAPRQIISGGYGNVRNTQCTSYTRPQPADSFYGVGTMSEHCNHIHVGY
jgi:hypothetical protein